MKSKKDKKNDLLRVGLISSHSEIYNMSENKEDFVYPVQFTDYKYELSNNLTRYQSLTSCILWELAVNLIIQIVK